MHAASERGSSDPHGRPLDARHPDTVRAGAQRRQHALFEPGRGLGRWREEQQLVRHAGEGADLLPAARAFVEVGEGGGAFVARQDAERELRRRVRRAVRNPSVSSRHPHFRS